MITVIDYGLGNITSVSRALEKLGATVVISSEADVIMASKAVVLPGVGAFKKAVQNLHDLSIYNAVKEYIASGKPYLGICLGLQLLFTSSSEYGITPGLDLISGTVDRFKSDVKIPHMGWNQISVKSSSEMFKGITEGSFFYYDHSFFVKPENTGVVSATTTYGDEFVCAVEKDNIWGVQFHPEKSSSKGLRLLRNFIDHAC